jgi:hypothetical protein
MPIDTKHARYEAIRARAKRVRDAVQGQEAVHAATTNYLPALSQQNASEYAAYLGRTGWYGATGRTFEGMLGMVFRQAPVLEEANGLEAMVADIDLSGTSLDGQSRQVLGEVMQAARVGVLVEYPSVPDDAQPSTVAQAQQSNLRPYATVYKSESITNWRVERVNNAMRIVVLVLHETVCEVDPDDPYKIKEVEQYRALLLLGGVYEQRIYRKAEIAGKDTWEETAITPLMNGRPMTEIPFFVFGPTENTLDEQQPPLQQLADVNFGHYKNTADLEHGAHFAGLPTPYVTGYQGKEGESVAIGSPTMLEFPDPAAKVGFLEFEGQGLSALEKRCEVKEQQMAALGARMLSPEKSGVEAEGTLAMRHTGESAVLANMANLVSQGMTRVLQAMADWAGVSSQVRYQLNTDFMPVGLSAQDMAGLVQAYQAGAISFDTLIDNLKRGEIVPAERTAEDEKAMIDANPPLAMTLAIEAAKNPDESGEGE